MDREGPERLTAGPKTGPSPLLVHRVIARLNVGGPAMHVAHLCRDLDPHGFRSTLLSGSITPDEGDMEYYAREMGVAPVRVPGLDRRLRPFAALRALFALFRTFRRERPLIVHTHTAMAGAVGRMAALLARVPVVVHTYHGHVLGGSYFSRLATTLFLTVERVLARGSDALVVLTQRQKGEMLGQLRIGSPPAYRVISLGLDLERFAKASIGSPEESELRLTARRALGLDPDAPVVGIVGRLVPVKNHELMLATIPFLVRELGERGPALRVLIVGDGERRQALEALAGELGVSDHLIWTGWSADLPALYPAMDLAVLTSHDEGTPVALLEALAAGVPVVSRAVGGIPEVLDEGRWGTLVPSPEPEAMAAALARVLSELPNSSTRLQARAHVMKQFGRDRLARDMAGLYQELLARKGLNRQR